MAKKAVEQTGLIPRSIIRTFDRFQKQLFPEAEKLIIQEFRISRYQFLVSIKCLASLIFIPLTVNFFLKNFLLIPLTENLWNNKQSDIFLNSYQQNQAFNELQKFQEKLYFDYLINSFDLRQYSSETFSQPASLRLQSLQSLSPKHNKENFYISDPKLLCGLRRFQPCEKLPPQAEVRSKTLPRTKYLLRWALTNEVTEGLRTWSRRGFEAVILNVPKLDRRPYFEQTLSAIYNTDNTWLPYQILSQGTEPPGTKYKHYVPGFISREATRYKVRNMSAKTNYKVTKYKTLSSQIRPSNFEITYEGTRYQDASHPGPERQVQILDNQLLQENAVIKKLIKDKIFELAIYYNHQSILALVNLISDFITFLVITLVIIYMKPQISILKSFLTESIYSLNDTKKSFLLILGTDLLVGFHSPRGWEICLELILRHFGLSENKDFVFLFVASFPVLLDTVFKYWIFRYLNKISPSTVATYHSMIE